MHQRLAILAQYRPVEMGLAIMNRYREELRPFFAKKETNPKDKIFRFLVQLAALCRLRELLEDYGASISEFLSDDLTRAGVAYALQIARQTADPEPFLRHFPHAHQFIS